MKEITKSRSLNQIIQDFRDSEGSFLSFFQQMSEKEKDLFRGWLHSLRVQSYSPLVHENEIGLEI